MRETVLIGQEFPPPNAVGKGFVEVTLQSSTAAVGVRNSLASGQVIVTRCILSFAGPTGLFYLYFSTAPTAAEGVGTVWINRQRAGNPTSVVIQQQRTGYYANAGRIGVVPPGDYTLGVHLQPGDSIVAQAMNTGPVYSQWWFFEP